MRAPGADASRAGLDVEWLFTADAEPGDSPRPLPLVTAGAAFKQALRAAGLPGHFSPHTLRHTYASLLLAQGVSPAYVQEQLGHASIELTVGTYGRWLRKKAPGAIDALDTGRVVTEAGETVAEPASEPEAQAAVAGSKVLPFVGDWRRGGDSNPRYRL